MLRASIACGCAEQPAVPGPMHATMEEMPWSRLYNLAANLPNTTHCRGDVECNGPECKNVLATISAARFRCIEMLFTASTKRMRTSLKQRFQHCKPHLTVAARGRRLSV
eukprot:2942171-Prymnesium_polylepis.5